MRLEGGENTTTSCVGKEVMFEGQGNQPEAEPNMQVGSAVGWKDCRLWAAVQHGKRSNAKSSNKLAMQVLRMFGLLPSPIRNFVVSVSTTGWSSRMKGFARFGINADANSHSDE